MIAPFSRRAHIENRLAEPVVAAGALLIWKVEHLIEAFGKHGTKEAPAYLAEDARRFACWRLLFHMGPQNCRRGKLGAIGNR
ncbi:hypothetical protein [Rhizobium mulingense]|uniref:hypothetical protein n=1 Tax=Rhizobium mulingense TaxID=3031128 RepID=UPI002B4893B7|nr:hypothetical protein [Rhizobium sp. MJ21]MEB3046013.1 hypothetical protein [Rhizobium sp. MJ21]